MLSTAALTRLGYVYGNLMVHVELKNQKLVERGIRILERATGARRDAAKRVLSEARNRVPVALVMLETGVTRAVASKALVATSGNVRRAIEVARR
jgi:N-acetylmuramic acid 6-phosphate etherase